MKRLLSLAVIAILISLPLAHAVNVSGTISSNVTWTEADSPYTVDGDVTIATNGWLGIEPGVEVRFNQNRVLAVRGGLVAQGTAGAPIRFIGATQTNDWWYGVDVLGTGSVAAVHCEFAHAGSGSGYAAIRKQGTGALSVSDSKFHHNGDQALYLYPGSSFLDLGHNSFSNNNIGVRIAVNGSLEDVTSTFLANAYDVVVDGGTLTQPVSWRLGPDYSMYVNSVTVATNGSLLVSPGTVLKFPSAGYILVNGRMEATGTPAEPIFFTDWRDDAAGGDANHDGSATSPATGWWRAIRCLGTGSVSLAYGTIRYAGQSDSRAVEISVSGAVALSHCLIGQNTGYGVYLASTNGRADLADCTIQSNSLSGIYLNGGSLSATGCAVRGNAEYGLLHEINDTTPYAWSSYAGNGIAAIGIKGVTMTRAVTWTRPRESETLRIIDNVLIASNASLTIDPGVVVEFSKGRWLDVYGGLRAEGAESNRVVLTGSAQSNNWWRGLELYETGSVVLAFADLSYAGETYPYLGINKQGGASLAMSNCSLHHINGIALLLRNAPGSLSLHNTWFSNNTFAVQLDPGASIDDATSRFTNNTYDVYHNSGTITQQVSWRLPRDCSLHAAGVTVATNGALTVGAGTVVKFASGAWLDVHGRLEATGTPDEPVCFTDWRDDTVGGDANHDGNSTAPAAGWWRAIRGYGTGSVSLARSTVRYAGQSDGRAIYRTGSGELKLAGCVIANNNGDGVQIDGAAGPVAITGCEFSGNNNGVRALNQSNDFAIARSAIFSNATYGVTNAGPATVDARGAWWGAASGPHHPSLNPSGAGDKVGNLVQFDPWRTNSDPLVVQCDLTVTDGTAPADGVFGALVQISWVVNNGGEQNTHALWKDRIYLSAMSNSLAGAVPLLAADNVNALAVGARYTNTQSAALPLSTNSIAGNYYLVVKVDAFDDVFEEEEKNNLRAWPIALSLPSLPDLEVARIVAPAHASAGDAISLSWTVTNNGATLASGPWRQSIYLSRDALVGGDQFLTNVAFSGSLMPASGWVCTQELVVSKSGPVGALYFVVETDSRGDVVEGNESNNVTLADAPMQVEAQLTLSRTVASILENSANSNVTITATRNGDLGTALTVLTESSNPAKLSVPASAIIPAGQASTTFKATVQRDGVYDADAVVAIIASSASYLSATTSITVVNVDAPQLGLALASGQLTEGISTTGTLVRPSGMTSSVVVALGNSIPGQVLVPAAVSLLPFQTSTTFEVQALDDNLVERTNTYTIKAGTPGYGSASNNLMVVDNDLPVVRLQLSEGAVSEGADSVALRGMASRDRTSTQPLSLSLTSSDTTAARVPARIIIPAMQTSVVFNVTVINDDLVDGPQTTEIGGAILETATGMPVGEIIPVALEVTDNDGPTLRLFLAHEVVGEGLDPATTATVFRNADPGGALSVSLASSDASEATVPASIVIPAGSNSAAFSIATLDDGVADGNQSVDLLASAEGYTGGTALLTVSDADQPDLAVQEVATPSGALTEEPFLVTFRIRNQGRAATTNGFAVRICRSDDPVIGDDTVMRQVAVSATIGAGQSLAQSVQVTAPKTVGDSWIVVTADSDNAIRELLEDNNFRAASDPVQVAAAYTASVSTDVDEAPVNTPIAMTGTAVQAGGVLPAAHKLVNIHVVVRGARRVISVPTDSQGCFSTVFQPLPYEAGDYMIAAAHPGETAPAPQDAFSLFGMKIAPMEALRLPEGESASRVTGITNLGPVALSDLSATVVSSPPSMTVTASLSTNQLPGDSGLTLGIAATANEGSAPGGRAVIRVSSAEGAVADLELDIVADAPHPRLSTDPANLAAGMTRGGQTMVSFSLTNSGGAATGPLDILLPAAAWLRSASGATLPELAAGSNATVTLLLTPSADLALGPHTGSLVIRATNASVTVPFSFLCQSTAIGDLQLTAVDEYTYYADGSPNVSNAAVTITDPITETLVVSTNTGPGGRVTIKGLLEAPYKIEITDPDHGTFKQTLLLAAGRTNAVTAFLPRHAVRYYWTVEPSLAGDRTIITIETVFETDVPMPVVTIEPTIIDVADMVGDEMQVDIKFSNHGLVAAENTRLEFGELEGFTFVPLVDDLGHLAAQSSITVPVMIHRKVAPSNKSKKSAGEDTCSATYQGFWDVLCEAADKSYSTPGFAVDSGGNCGGGGRGSLRNAKRQWRRSGSPGTTHNWRRKRCSLSL